MDSCDEWRQLHVEQATPGSCIAACTAMVANFRGAGVSEATLRTEWGSEPYFAFQAADHLNMLDRCLDPLEPATHPFLARLVTRHPRIVTMNGGPWTLFQRTRFGAPLHGDMKNGRPATEIRHEPLMWHAVLMVEASERDYLVLDPYFPATGQPWRVSRSEWVDCWTGVVLLFEDEF